MNLADLVPLALVENPQDDVAERNFVVLGWKPVCPCGGTYMYESWTDTLTGGTYQGKLVLPWYGSPVSACLRSASSTKSTSRR